MAVATRRTVRWLGMSGAMAAVLGFGWTGLAGAGEGGGGQGRANRGRSGEVDRNNDPRGPHDGLQHRNGQIDQGWHGGRNDGGGQAADADDGRGRGACDRGCREGERRELCQHLRERLQERRGGCEGGRRQELRERIRERLQNVPPERREELRERIRERLQGRCGQMPPEKREELKEKFKEHWDRGLHRGADDDKGQGGGGFGRDREKWDDYAGKPGHGNEAPGGPKEK